MIVDCVPDELESKLEIFSLLDRMAPPLAILRNADPELSIADLASCTYRADRCLAVQLAFGRSAPGRDSCAWSRPASTKAEVLDAVIAFWTRLGFLAQSNLQLDPQKRHMQELCFNPASRTPLPSGTSLPSYS